MVAPERIGRYEVDGVLGHGGFATVYSAVDPMLDARVAVKLLAENWCLDPDVVARFVREAQIMWRSDDDHIVRVHTVGETDDGRPYFVMQLADRGSLADRLHAVTGSAGLRPREAVDLAARLADAVEVIHRLGFVHRDLKPSNVLFRSRRVHEDGDDDEVLMLADLGLAKALSDASGLASSVGTAAYMPPEQADPSRAADERSDVYSLGVITYELLTGDVPTAGAEVRPSLAAIPGIAPSTVDAVTSALDPRIELRPPSAAAFRDRARLVGRCRSRQCRVESHGRSNAEAAARDSRSGRDRRGVLRRGRLGKESLRGSACRTHDRGFAHLDERDRGHQRAHARVDHYGTR